MSPNRLGDGYQIKREESWNQAGTVAQTKALVFPSMADNRIS